ncbi:hypothetical protein BB558_000198, partial [Smittium angustum]
MTIGGTKRAARYDTEIFSVKRKNVKLQATVLGEKKAKKLYKNAYLSTIITVKVVSIPKTSRSSFQVEFGELNLTTKVDLKT